MLKNFRETNNYLLLDGFKLNTTFSGFSEGSSMIPDIKFGKDYYTNISGCEYNVIRVDMILFTDKGNYIFFHTPDGKVRGRHIGHLKGISPIFDNIEDYKHYCLTEEVRYNFREIPTIENYFREFYDECSSYRTWLGALVVNTFYWNKKEGKVSAVPTEFKYAWIDKDGGHLIFDTPIPCEERFLTQEECFKNNFKLNLGEFNEDKPKTQVFKVSVTLEVVAETIEEAQEVAKKKVAYLQE